MIAVSRSMIHDANGSKTSHTPTATSNPAAGASSSSAASSRPAFSAPGVDSRLLEMLSSSPPSLDAGGDLYPNVGGRPSVSVLPPVHAGASGSDAGKGKGKPGADGAGGGKARADDAAAKKLAKKKRAQATGSRSFRKEPVAKVRSKGLSSSLAKGLASNAQLLQRQGGGMGADADFYGRGARGGYGGNALFVEAWTAVNTDPIELRLSEDMPVDDVIDVIMEKHTQLGRKPALLPDADLYELRMIEDEDDGTPDMDLPPLDRSMNLKASGVTQVALCLKKGVSASAAAAAAPRLGGDLTGSPFMGRKNRGISLDLNQRLSRRKDGTFFLRIHMPDHVSHVLPVTDDLKLSDLLPLIAKKRPADEVISPQHYKFVHMDGSDTDMTMELHEVNADELRLVRRTAGAELQVIPEDEATEAPRQRFLFTRETAQFYEAFHVIKTNQRGKRQERIMAIDGEKIYNKLPPSSGNSDRVSRPFRLLCDVKFITTLPNDKRSFRIGFKDNEVREYQADTKLECSKIVAKVMYLMRMRDS